MEITREIPWFCIRIKCGLVMPQPLTPVTMYAGVGIVCVNPRFYAAAVVWNMELTQKIPNSWIWWEELVAMEAYNYSSGLLAVCH